MPTNFNINPPIQGLSVNVRSVRCWFYPSETELSAEVTPVTAHYVVFDAFSANNANGTYFGRGAIDTGVPTAMERFKASDVQTLMTEAFG